MSLRFLILIWAPSVSTNALRISVHACEGPPPGFYFHLDSHRRRRVKDSASLSLPCSILPAIHLPLQSVVVVWLGKRMGQQATQLFREMGRKNCPCEMAVVPPGQSAWLSGTKSPWRATGLARGGGRKKDSHNAEGNSNGVTSLAKCTALVRPPCKGAGELRWLTR